MEGIEGLVEGVLRLLHLVISSKELFLSAQVLTPKYGL